MADESVSMFVAVTDSSPEAAQQFLDMAGGDVSMAVDLWMNNADLRTQVTGATDAQAPTTSSNRENPITIDDDDVEDDDIQETGSRQVGGGTGPSMEDDEAMARRLQEEMYGGGGSAGGGGGMMDPEGVRAPMARTTETLVGPGSDWRDDTNEMRAAVAEQMFARQQRRARGAPGIFNQQEAASIWSEDDPNNPEVHRQVLSRATGGASEQSSKSNLLADLFRPPYEIMSPHLTWSAARDQGKDEEKWILVNVQDPSIFDCQVLNRDIWKNAQIQETIRENFVFLQYSKSDPRGQEYINYYFNTQREREDAYPHIAIVDPRTGEQVKTWSGSPSPKANEFLMDLHEFLDRYSLRMDQKNPVQAKRKEKRKDVAEMSEEEMMQMAMQASLDNGTGGGLKEEDPDALTKASDSGINGKGKAPVTAQPDPMDTDVESSAAPNGTPTTSQATSPFAAISSTNPHTEPTSTNPAETTRIQFRYSGGRIIRRFDLNDPVRRIYEWLKAAPFEGKEGSNFELISSGKNLIDMLEVPIGEAGLKQGTVMVEFTED